MWQKSLSKFSVDTIEMTTTLQYLQQGCPYGKCLRFRRYGGILHTTMPLNDAIFRNVGDLMNLFRLATCVV